MIQRIAPVAFLLMLGACAAPAPRALPELARVPSAFEMSARVSVRSGDRSDIARLRWVHRPDSDQWIISSPFGNEIARIESSARGATLWQAGAQPQEAESFAALSERVMGVALEPTLLGAWLHGNPHIATPANWQVTIDEMQQAGAVELARRITASSGEVVLKFVVDHYRAI